MWRQILRRIVRSFRIFTLSGPTTTLCPECGFELRMKRIRALRHAVVWACYGCKSVFDLSLHKLNMKVME